MNRKKKNILLAFCLAGVLLIGGIFAYFTDTDDAVNTFTVGKVDIDLEEPGWDPDNPPVDIVPNKVITKDPQVRNTGKNDAFVFVEISVPVANISVADAQGNAGAKADTELFTYSVNEGWVEVGSATPDAENSAVKHVYAYIEGAGMKKVAPGEVTSPVFNKVKFVNAAGSQGLEGKSLNIGVKAFAIQTEELNDGAAVNSGAEDGANDKTAPLDVWSIVKNQAY